MRDSASVLMSELVCSGGDAGVLTKLLVDRRTLSTFACTADPGQSRYL